MNIFLKVFIFIVFFFETKKKTFKLEIDRVVSFFQVKKEKKGEYTVVVFKLTDTYLFIYIYL